MNKMKQRKEMETKRLIRMHLKPITERRERDKIK